MMNLSHSNLRELADFEERCSSLLTDGYDVLFDTTLQDRRFRKLRHRRNGNVVTLTLINHVLEQKTNGHVVFYNQYAG